METFFDLMLNISRKYSPKLWSDNIILIMLKKSRDS